MDHVPDRRRGCRQVWIVGEQRLAGGGVFAADDPVIAGGESFRIKPDARQRLGCQFFISRKRQQCLA